MNKPEATPPAGLAEELALILAQLLRQPLPPSARADAARALTLAQRLARTLASPPTVREFDHATFEALIAIAGPDTGPALLAQVVEDLQTIDRALALALPAADWPALRAQSHVALSISGSLGATHLYRMAERLNRAAHDQDRAALTDLAPAVTGALARALAFVRAHPDCPTGPGTRPAARGRD